jgi:hypothetical protein
MLNMYYDFGHKYNYNHLQKHLELDSYIINVLLKWKELESIVEYMTFQIKAKLYMMHATTFVMLCYVHGDMKVLGFNF